MNLELENKELKNEIKLLKDELSLSPDELIYLSKYNKLTKNKINIYIDNKNDINYKSPNGNTFLFYAINHNNDDIIKLLIEKGIDINHQNIYGYTALMKVCEKGNYNIAKLLLEKGAHIHYQNNWGNTALKLACINKNYKINDNLQLVKLLLNNNNIDDIKSIINKQDINNWSALMKVCNDGDYNLAKLLLEYGADYKLKNDNNENALDLAIKKGHTEIVKLLNS